MSIEDDVALFERTALLRLMGRDALRIVAIGAESRFFGEGAMLFQQGQASDGAYVVQQGSVALIGDQGEVVASAGALLNEHALLIATFHPVTVVARENTTIVRIARSMFLRVLEGYPEAALRLRDSLAARVEAATEEMTRVGRLLRDAN